MGVQIQSKMIRTLILSLTQELRTTFGKIPNKVVVTSEQVVTIFRGKLYRFMLVSFLHIYQAAFEINHFSIDFSFEHTGSIQIHSTF